MKKRVPMWAYVLAFPLQLVAIPLLLLFIIVAVLEGVLHGDFKVLPRFVRDIWNSHKGFRGGKK